MISDQLGVSLHDKATRGMALSELEQQQLEQWYAEKDGEDSSILAKPTSFSDTSLQTKIDATLMQIGVMAKRLQEMVLENQSIRQEISALRQQLITTAIYKQAV